MPIGILPTTLLPKIFIIKSAKSSVKFSVSFIKKAIKSHSYAGIIIGAIRISFLSTYRDTDNILNLGLRAASPSL